MSAMALAYLAVLLGSFSFECMIGAVVLGLLGSILSLIAFWVTAYLRYSASGQQCATSKAGSWYPGEGDKLTT